MIFPARLLALRRQKGLTQHELARQVNISRSALSLYELGKREPDHATMTTLAGFFDTTVDFLLGRTDESHPPGKPPSGAQEPVRIPVYNERHTGQPTPACEEIIGYEYALRDQVRDGEYFYLRVKGNSMIDARIRNGDLVLVRKQDSLENGQIGVVVLNGEAVVRRFFRQGETAILQPENPADEPIAAQLGDIVVLGEVIEARIKLNIFE